MQSKQFKFIALIIVIIVIVAGIGIMTNKTQGPGKLDAFAKALTSSGTKFYGAFWCPHCQAEKALFGTSKKYLPYIECSNPDQSVTQICKDNKIESYPTWDFPKGITFTSTNTPIVCEVRPGTPGEPEVCSKVGSQYYKTWLFPEFTSFYVKSMTEPIHKDSTWQFAIGSETSGEVPLEFLAAQIGYVLPK